MLLCEGCKKYVDVMKEVLFISGAFTVHVKRCKDCILIAQNMLPQIMLDSQS